MRRICYSVAMSLDGFIAGPNGEADWILMDPDIDFAEIFSRFDTLLMGRKTFEFTGSGSGGGSGPFSGFKVVVVSRTLDPRKHPKVTILGADVAAQLKALRDQPGKDIWLFGGGELFRSLIDLGLVDSVSVAVIPVLLGQGIPLLPVTGTRSSLTLRKHQVYPKTGTVALEYDITPRRTPSRRRSSKK